VSGGVLTIVDSLSRAQWFTQADRRRVTFGLAAFALLLLCIFPRHYRSVVDLAPQDSNTSGLSSILSQLGGNYAALVGNHQPVEMDVTIARSYDVMQATAKKLGMIDQSDVYASTAAAVREIESKVTVSALRGSIVEIEVKESDPAQAIELSTAYADALQQRLTQLSLDAADYKRKILKDRFRDAAVRLSHAQADVEAFRTKYHLPSPAQELGSSVLQISRLRGELMGKRVELEKALHFNTSESMVVKSLRTEIAALQAQLEQTSTQTRMPDGLTAAGISKIYFQYNDLEREFGFSQGLYDSYKRYLEGVALEELTSSFNMRVIQQPYVDPSFQFNLWAVLSLLVVIGLAAASEMYMARNPLAKRYAR